MESLDTSPPNRLVVELERRLRGIAVIVSSFVGSWAASAQLQLVEAHVLVALADADRSTDAIELSAGSRVPLDAVYPALHRLTGRGYVHEEHHRYSLTAAGHLLVAALDRARREGIQSYIAQLSPDELLRLETVLRSR